MENENENENEVVNGYVNGIEIPFTNYLYYTSL
jgi:hypothetical protein